MRSVGIPFAAVLAVLGVSHPARGENIAVQVGGSLVKNATREDCARRAVRAMEKEKFVFAETDAQGNVWGCSDKVSALVLSSPDPDGTAFLVFVAAGDGQEAERVRNALRSDIREVPSDPKAPKRIGTPDARRKAKVPVFRWQVGKHGKVSTLRFFEAGASIALEKQDMAVKYSCNFLVLSGGQGGIAAAFVAPGANGLSVNLGTVVASWDEETSTRLLKSVEEGIVKLFFE